MLDLKIMELVTPEDRPRDDRPFFAVHPDTLYPTMLEYIQAALAGDIQPIPARCRQFLIMARGIDPAAWRLATTPYSEAKESLIDTEMRLRGAALEICRRWFTTALHEEHNDEPLGLHILAGDKEWRT